METNEINGQAQPEQPQPTPVLNQSQPQQPLLYDPGFVARMADLIRDVFDPAYILLFGSMANGTSHSDTLSYDLLIATHDTPQYNWLAVKRYLKTKMPILSLRSPPRFFIWHVPRVYYCIAATATISAGREKPLCSLRRRATQNNITVRSWRSEPSFWSRRIWP